MRSDDGVCSFVLTGDDSLAAGILADLVRNGILVNEFSEVRTGLEEIFMRVTEGIVQ